MNKHFKHLFVLMFLILTMSFVSAGLTDGLEEYWKLDESSGTTMTGEISNDGTSSNVTVNQSGKIIKSYLFVSASSSYAGSFTENYHFERTQAFSVSFWVKTSQASATIFGNYSNGRGWDVQLYLGKVWFDLYNSGTNAIYVNSTNTVNTNDWVNIAITYDGSSTAEGCKIYINGTLETNVVGRDDLTGTIISTRPFEVGRYYNGSIYTGYYNGYLDEFGIWNKELSQAEIIQLYNSGAGNSYPFIDLTSPTASVDTGTYNNNFSVTLDNNGVADIYYTTDGSDPDDTDTLYSGAISITGTTTLKAISWVSDENKSEISSYTYTMVIAGTPTADKDSGLYYDPFNVTLTKTGTTTGTKLTYTLNGDAPTIASTEYTTPIEISESLTLKFAEFKTGYTATSIVTKTYEVREPIINFYFYDENTLLPIPTVTITDANGSVYTSDANGLWVASLTGAKSLEISKTGYDTRPFEFYFKADANYNFLLSPTGTDSEIEFLVKDTNDNAWANKYLMFKNDDINTSLKSYIPYNDSGGNIFYFKTKVKLKLNHIVFRTSNTGATTILLENAAGTTTYKTIGSATYTSGNTYTVIFHGDLRSKAEYRMSAPSVNIFSLKSSGDYVANKYIIKTASGNLLGQEASYSSDIIVTPTPDISIFNSILTSSSGTATANILPAGDYNALLYNATGDLNYTYAKTTVTVNKPKNEITLGAISPYDITVGGLLGYSLTNQSAASVAFNVFAGTTDFYHFSVVDYNAVAADRKYIPRQYFTQVPMGTEYSSTLLYQPYLLLETDAVVPKITVIDELNKPIGDVDIFISRYISNIMTIVESGKTTSVGTLSFSAYPLEYYYVSVIYNGVDKGTYRVQPRESTDNFIIVIDTTTTTTPSTYIITADFSDTNKVVNIDDSNISVDVTVKQSQNLATTYNLYLMQNNVVKASTSGAIASRTKNITYTFDSSVVDTTNNNLVIRLVVNYPDGNQTFYYTITTVENEKGLMYYAPKMVEDIGQPLAIILAILITGIILAVITLSGLNIGTTAIAILGILILGVFMFLGWLDIGVTVAGFDIARFFYILMSIAMIYMLMRGEQYA